jgi:hypothetical protein
MGSGAGCCIDGHRIEYYWSRILLLLAAEKCCRLFTTTTTTTSSSNNIAEVQILATLNLAALTSNFLTVAVFVIVDV